MAYIQFSLWYSVYICLFEISICSAIQSCPADSHLFPNFYSEPTWWTWTPHVLFTILLYFSFATYPSLLSSLLSHTSAVIFACLYDIILSNQCCLSLFFCLCNLEKCYAMINVLVTCGACLQTKGKYFQCVI
jgi:hypothetical protein